MHQSFYNPGPSKIIVTGVANSENMVSLLENQGVVTPGGGHQFAMIKKHHQNGRRGGVGIANRQS